MSGKRQYGRDEGAHAEHDEGGLQAANMVGEKYYDDATEELPDRKRPLPCPVATTAYFER